jgi:solute carrier family 13 (sodium-dependent dicarboxylate transporter), member 2/3/5
VLVRLTGLFLGPLLFLLLFSGILPAVFSPEATKVLAVAAWMICWWITEAIPIPATALLPIILLPLLGVFGLPEATAPYADPIIFLFMGGFILAIALEKQRLHLRIALNLIRFTGTNPNGIILGFTLATAFLSMWISNTATAVMMLPIALSVISLLQQQYEASSAGNSKGFYYFGLSLMLSIAYAANIGGVMTIIGTPPNVVLVGYMRQFYNYDLTFGTWLLVGVPVGVVLLALNYLLLVKVFFPNRIPGLAGSRALIEEQVRGLGKFSRGEKRVSVVFILTAFAWIFRSPLNELIGTNLLNDTVIAMAGGLSTFLVPVSLKKGEFLLDWKSMDRLPWGILLLFGGGLALAKAMEATGIIQLVGQAIADQGQVRLWVLLLLVTSVSLFLTEVMSNVALATIFLPVVFGLADGLQLPPLLLAIPVTMATSFAFMMPISTPPNAVVFSSGHIRVQEMIKVGLVLNLLSILVLLLASFTLVRWVYPGG